MKAARLSALVRAIRGASMFGMFGIAGAGVACLPPDRAIERGAVYIELTANAKKVDVSGFEIAFDRITVVAGADLINCHSVYFVERPLPPLAVFDVFTPRMFELRSITEVECVAAGGFIVNDSEPTIATGISDEELGLLQPNGPGTLRAGSAHVVANLRYVVRGGADDPNAYRRKFDLTVFGMANAKTALVKVPRGDKTDVRITFDTDRVARALVPLLVWDVDRDQVITSAELSPSAAEAFRNELGDAWTLTSVNTPISASRLTLPVGSAINRAPAFGGLQPAPPLL